MRQLKKTLLTLVALLAVTTGAWATDTYTVTFAANGNTKTVENVTLPKNFQCSYSNADGELDLILKELYGWTGDSGETVCANWSTPTSSDANKVVAGKDNDGHYITIDNVFEGTVTITGDYYVNYSLTSYSLEISIAAVPVTPVPITWDTTTKTATIASMPAGNVIVIPEYYPQAALAMSTDATPVALAPTANNSARANTDDPLVEGGTVAGIVDGEALLEEGQGTLLYHFSATQLDDAALEALTATDWTDKVPTADGLAEGTVYVYYYIKGADDLPGITQGAKFTFSDSDIQELAVTLLPEPTYNVEFAEGTNPEAPAEPIWTASPATDVKKGQTVTVTYSGDRKVIGVKAEKKGAAGKPVSEITPDDIFKVIASDGIIYDNIAAAESAGTVAQGLIVYVGSNTGNENYNHGLALALNDENSNTQGGAINACNAKNTSTPIVDALWILPSQGQWNTMFNAAGGDWKLRDCFSSAGGNNMVKDGEYWSSGDIQPRYNYICNVRACIVF